MDVFTNIPFSTTSVIVVGAATLVLVATILLKQHRNYRSNLPPGPRAIPVFGHLHLFIDKTKPLHQILNSLSPLYGPIMHLKFGSCPVLVISSSDLAKECFTVNDKSFASRPQLTQGQLLGSNYSMLGWAPYGPYWRNARKICVVELLTSKRIQSFEPKRMQEICKTVKSLFHQTQLQSIINMRSVLSHLSFNILRTMIIDDRYFGEDMGISVDLVTRLIKESFVLHGVICIGDYIPWLKWLDLQGYEKAMKKVHGKLDFYMQRIVEKHREKGLKEEGVVEDFIDVLISQAEENGGAIPDKDKFVKATAIGHSIEVCTGPAPPYYSTTSTAEANIGNVMSNPYGATHAQTYTQGLTMPKHRNANISLEERDSQLTIQLDQELNPRRSTMRNPMPQSKCVRDTSPSTQPTNTGKIFFRGLREQ